MTRARISLAAALIAHILAWAASIFLLFGPVYSGSDGGSATLIEVNGLWVAVPLVIPVALTAVTLIASRPNAPRPLLMATLRWASFALLLLFCLISALSIGLFYLPSAIAMLVHAILKTVESTR